MLEPVIAVDITIDSTGTPRQGFGTPMIPSHNATWPERTRSYGSTAEAGADWVTTSPEYRALAAIFSQDNPPEVAKIGRVASPVTMKYELDVKTAVALHNYQLAASGQGFDDVTVAYLTGATTSKGLIHAGLLNALNAITSKNFTAAFQVLALADFVVTADPATDKINKVAHGLGDCDGPFQFVNVGGALPAGIAALTDYWAIKVDGDNIKIADSLAHALAGTAVDITDAGTGVTTLNITGLTRSPTLRVIVTGNATGNWFSLGVVIADIGRVGIRMTHASATLDEDLAAILLEDDEWYCMLTLYNSHDYVQEAAAWAEANGRVYVVDVPEWEAANTAFNIESPASTDTLGQMCALGYKRTMYSYHPRQAAFFSAAWMGNWLPTTPGQATAALKTLDGVETTKLTSTQLANLTNRRASAYLRRGGRGITWESKVPSTVYEYLDVTRNIDYLKDGVATSGFGLLAGSQIIPYTPEGTAQLGGVVLGFLKGEATDNGVLDKGTADVTPPKFSSIPTQDKKDRVLRKLKFSGRLSGAIHAAKIDGTVTF